MAGWRHLSKVGAEFLVSGSVIVAVSLAVLLYDELVHGGRDMVTSFSVLFLWLGGIGVLAGMVLRVLARSRVRTARSPFSSGWRPPPVSRSRH